MSERCGSGERTAWGLDAVSTRQIKDNLSAGLRVPRSDTSETDAGQCRHLATL